MNARLAAAITHWAYVAPLLTPPTNEAQYQALVESLDALLDAGGSDESHALAGLTVAVGELVSAYEQHHYPMPAQMTALEALRFFMERDGLRQKDLPEIGNQSKVSEILNARRSLNLRQTKALAARFGVPISMFAG
ncbi:MAG: transcriptional regulator [Gammaproteobacteria bacterium]|uniref:helix-turn-helix domain-containing protein n=1 Tax=Rhodoferax sp. TaxID=50421 RepID=UPI00182B0BA7|nr:transcriptional regulator [Rhodoferax sp.]MBU3899071.1 transcriptional regulator [Gammaproteobacteria bacterium]MBA3057629.1 transcriptional regulator [Rhodoferax sp.]MBU3997631.1 transcriptional regulator [Gammaproteobacteria bacterium]MBU4018515.1 transcriptional regulator [Gammaproteobacteria bacterium]MBU4080527.1 transcriptional regulator [Gammaproteobacteria bacterium]